MTLVVRSDPFRDVDRFLQQVWRSPGPRPATMPMDAYRRGDRFLVSIDLPGVDPESIDVTVEDNVLTVRAERPAPERADDVETLVAERPTGAQSRQILLGEHLDTAAIEAEYEGGVLSLVIPVSEQAKPQRIPVRRRTATGEHELTG